MNAFISDFTMFLAIFLNAFIAVWPLFKMCLIPVAKFPFATHLSMFFGVFECFILVLGFPNKLVLQDTGVLCKIVDVEDITPLFYWSGGFDGSYNFAFYRWRLFFLVLHQQYVVMYFPCRPCIQG